MYRIADYGDMIADRQRMDAYARAIQQVVTPGSVVLDLGAGTGIFSLLACQNGARKVFAVDTTPALSLARAAAQANGCEDRLVLIPEHSSRVQLPEPADVMISDLRGSLPFLGTNLIDLIDARRRLLAPGGRLIPRADRLWAAAVEVPEAWDKLTGPWVGRPFGLDLQSALPFLTNAPRQAKLTPEQLLSEPREWAVLSYETMSEPNVQGAVQLRVERDGLAHGLGIWFDADLAEGVGFSNAPTAPRCIYGQSWLPWPEPVAVRPGDRIDVTLRVHLVADDYVWCWDSQLRDAKAPERVRQEFRQTTFRSAPFTPERLARLASSHVPRLNEEGRLTLAVLDRMRGEKSLGDLAVALATEHPERFPTPHQALRFLGELTSRWGE